MTDRQQIMCRAAEVMYTEGYILVQQFWPDQVLGLVTILQMCKPQPKLEYNSFKDCSVFLSDFQPKESFFVPLAMVDLNLRQQGKCMAFSLVNACPALGFSGVPSRYVDCLMTLFPAEHYDACFQCKDGMVPTLKSTASCQTIFICPRST